MIWVFGDCELDTQLYTLRRSDQTARLQPRTYKILMYLLEHRDRVVSKDELCEQIWPDQFIANATLESAIRSVRKAVGDSGREQRLIQTVWGYGYRFIATVDEPTPHPVTGDQSGLLPDLLEDDGVQHVHAQQVQSELSRRLIRQGLDTKPAGVIGRELELSRLRQLWEQVQQGQGQAVLITGESGIGKSQLLQTFRHGLTPGEVTVLEGYGVSGRSTVPYLPLRGIIRQLCKIAVTDDHITSMVKLSDRLHRLQDDSTATASYLAHLISPPPAADQRATRHPQLAQVRTGAAICQLLLASSQPHPMVLTIENWHDIDRATATCLTELITSLTDAPILVLITGHPSASPTWDNSLPVTRIDLSPLSSEDSLSLIRTIATPAPLSVESNQAILSRAGGNPLYLKEATRLLSTAAVDKPGHHLPTDLRDLILARIEQLPSGAKRVLQLAAVLAPHLTHALLHDLWKEARDLQTELDELEHLTGWLLPLPQDPLTYTFRHALIQDVVYGHIPPHQRQLDHAKAGDELACQSAFHLRDTADVRAYHYTHSDQTVKAIDSLIAWADSATRQHMDTESLAALQKALIYVEQLAPERQRDYRPNLILRQAQSHIALGHLTEAVELLRSSTSDQGLAIAPQFRGQYALLLSQTYSKLDNWIAAGQHAQHALDIAIATQDQTLKGQAHEILAQERYWAGEPAAGVEHSQYAVALLEPSASPSRLGMAYLTLGLNTLLSGDFPRTLHAANQVRTINTSDPDPHLLTYANWLTGWAQAAFGTTEAGIQACQQSLETAPDPLSVAFALGGLGYAYLESDMPDAAIPHLEQAVDRMQHFQRQRFASLYMTFLGEANRLRHDIESASHWLETSLALAQTTDYRAGTAWSQRALGRLSVHLSALAQADTHLQAALHLFDLMQARFESARTHLDLAELAITWSHPELATQHFTSAATQFQALQVTRYVDHVHQRTQTLKLSIPPQV